MMEFIFILNLKKLWKITLGLLMKLINIKYQF